MSTQKTKKAMNRVVYWTVWGAVQWIVDAALGRTVDVGVNRAMWGAARSAVDRAVGDAVVDAVHRAVHEYPPHPGLQDFLRSSGIRKTR